MTIRWQTRCNGLSLVIAVGFFVTPSASFAQQPSDAIARAKLARDLAEQKATAEVDQALQNAEQLAKLSTAKAAESLKAAQTTLSLTVGLGNIKQDELAKKLEARIAQLERRTPAKDGTDPKMAEAKASQRKVLEAAVEESKVVADGLKKAADQQDLGRPEDAARTIALLRAKYPSNPELAFAAGQGYTAAQMRADAEISRLYADAWLQSNRQLVASALPATSDLQFPKADAWKDLTKRRSRQDKIQLSEKEEQILKSLDTAVQANFLDRPFEEALQELSNQINQEIFIDKDSLKETGVDLTRPVRFKGNVTARTALRGLLQSNALTFIVKNEMIQVVTLERAEREMTTRSYYLGDLVLGTGPFGNGVVWGPIASLQQAEENGRVIVKAIKDSIDPKSWKENGGACSVTFHLPTMSVLVRASTEVHAALGNGFNTSSKK
jgi:hypothetical protein